MPYIPLTPEQFNKAKQAGFSAEKIIEMEKRRKTEMESATQPSQTQEPGVVQSIVQGVSAPFLKLGVSATRGVESLGRAYQGASRLMEGDKVGAGEAIKQASEALQKPANLGYFGTVAPLKPLTKQGEILPDPQAIKEAFGTGAEIASYGIGGPAVARGAIGAVKGVVPGAIKSAFKTGLASGFVGGTGAGLREGQDIPEALMTGVQTAAVAGPLSAAIPAVGAGIRKLTNIPAQKTAQEVAERALIEAGTPEAQIATKTIAPSGKIVTDKTAQEVIKQGIPEVDVALIKTSNVPDQNKMLKMLDIRQAKETNKAITERASDIVGDTFIKKVAEPIQNLNKAAGLRLNAVAETLKGKVVDATPAIQDFTGAIDNAGVKVKKDETGNLILDFVNSDFEGLPKVQNKFNLLFNRLQRVMRKNDAYEYHRIKKYIDEIVDYGKRTEGLTGKAENIFKSFRRNIDTVLDNNFDEYNQINTVYADTISELDNLGSFIGKKFKLNDKFADASVGVKMRGLLSNNQSRADMLKYLDSMQKTLKKYGVEMDEDIVRQANFIDMLETIFGSEAPSSLLGQTEKAVRGVAGVGQEIMQGNFGKAGVKGLLTAYEATRGINRENQIKALRQLLSEGVKKKVSNFGKIK